MQAVLGEAIRLDPATIGALTTDLATPSRGLRGVQNTSGFSINRQNRTGVAGAYHRYYLDSETYTTGNLSLGSGQFGPGAVNG